MNWTRCAMLPEADSRVLWWGIYELAELLIKGYILQSVGTCITCMSLDMRLGFCLSGSFSMRHQSSPGAARLDQSCSGAYITSCPHPTPHRAGCRRLILHLGAHCTGAQSSSCSYDDVSHHMKNYSVWGVSSELQEMLHFHFSSPPSDMSWVCC